MHSSLPSGRVTSIVGCTAGNGTPKPSSPPFGRMSPTPGSTAGDGTAKPFLPLPKRTSSTLGSTSGNGSGTGTGTGPGTSRTQNDTNSRLPSRRNTSSKNLQEHDKLEAQQNPVPIPAIDFTLLNGAIDEATDVITVKAVAAVRAVSEHGNNNNNVDEDLLSADKNDSGFASGGDWRNNQSGGNPFAIQTNDGSYGNFDSCNGRYGRMQDSTRCSCNSNSCAHSYGKEEARKNARKRKYGILTSVFVDYALEPSRVPYRDRYVGGRLDDPIYDANGDPIAHPPNGPGSLQDLMSTLFDPTNVNHWINPTTMVLKDKKPKATLHFLLIPFGQTFSTMDDLICGDKGVEAIKQLLKRAKILIARETMRHHGIKFTMGFHVLPSMKQIHLHVISTDFCHINTLSAYNKFTTSYFMSPEQVILRITEKWHVRDVHFLSAAETKRFNKMRTDTEPQCLECLANSTSSLRSRSLNGSGGGGRGGGGHAWDNENKSVTSLLSFASIPPSPFASTSASEKSRGKDKDAAYPKIVYATAPIIQEIPILYTNSSVAAAAAAALSAANPGMFPHTTRKFEREAAFQALKLHRQIHHPHPYVKSELSPSSDHHDLLNDNNDDEEIYDSSYGDQDTDYYDKQYYDFLDHFNYHKHDRTQDRHERKRDYASVVALASVNPHVPRIRVPRRGA
ncbi:hypothetical protein BGW39_006033 [Mortierella sp. 14UC]|nr:hypothetical protein BGW39_006033 [Mortierella sp. 14UC]